MKKIIFIVFIVLYAVSFTLGDSFTTLDPNKSIMYVVLRSPDKDGNSYLLGYNMTTADLVSKIAVDNFQGNELYSMVTRADDDTGLYFFGENPNDDYKTVAFRYDTQLQTIQGNSYQSDCPVQYLTWVGGEGLWGIKSMSTTNSFNSWTNYTIVSISPEFELTELATFTSSGEAPFPPRDQWGCLKTFPSWSAVDPTQRLLFIDDSKLTTVSYVVSPPTVIDQKQVQSMTIPSYFENFNLFGITFKSNRVYFAQQDLRTGRVKYLLGITKDIAEFNFYQRSHIIFDENKNQYTVYILTGKTSDIDPGLFEFQIFVYGFSDSSTMELLYTIPVGSSPSYADMYPVQVIN